MPLTMLCIATYRKGDEFLKECRRLGCRVLLLTDQSLRDSDWPRDSIDEMNAIWDTWVAPGRPPTRACVEARLASPKYAVEIRVLAAR